MKILVVAPAWVGDMVMSQSLVEVLRNRSDSGEVHVLAPAATAPLAERLPGVAAVHVLPVGHGALALAARRRSGVSLRAGAYDQAIVLPNSFKSALVPWWAGIPRRTGWRGEHRYGVLNDVRRLDPRRLTRMVERFVALGLPPNAPLPDPLPAPVLRREPRMSAGACDRLGLSTARPVLALCPGAEYGPAKRWPPRHFADVAEYWIARGGAVWLFGSVVDREVTAAVTALLSSPARERAADLAGRTSLTEAVDLLAVADQVVTNDSGLMHVACALGRRVVAVYGSTSPEFTPPLAPDAQVVRDPPPCSPCFERVCPLGHTRCLVDLPASRVIMRLSVAAPLSVSGHSVTGLSVSGQGS